MTAVMKESGGSAHNLLMSATTPTQVKGANAVSQSGPSWRAVALPVEHGGWSFLIEPLILGLVVAPSVAGGWLALAAVAAFLARQPMKLAALDRRRGARYPRTALAEKFLAFYSIVALLAFGAAFSLSPTAVLAPLALAAPFAVAALWRDFQGRGREALPEIAAGIALGASATAIIVAGRGAADIAWLAWALGAGRTITAVLYVRARVRVDRHLTEASRFALARPVLFVHALALLAAVFAARASLLSPIAASAFALLLLRTVYGLAPGQKPIRPQMLGVQEVVVGIACLCLFAIGLTTT